MLSPYTSGPTTGREVEYPTTCTVKEGKPQFRTVAIHHLDTATVMMQEWNVSMVSTKCTKYVSG